VAASLLTEHYDAAAVAVQVVRFRQLRAALSPQQLRRVLAASRLLGPRAQVRSLALT